MSRPTQPPSRGRHWRYNGMLFTRLDAFTWDWCGTVQLQRSSDLPRFWHAYFIGWFGGARGRLYAGARRAIDALRELSTKCREHDYASVADWLDGKVQTEEDNG